MRRSDIELKYVRWLFGVRPSTLWDNFVHDEFEARYCEPGTPLSAKGGASIAPDFADWQVRLT